jgi:signal transduction histidine kinase
METSHHPPLKKERQQTDESLTVERGKTDDSFETYKVKAESITDRAVSANRVEADSIRYKRRADADIERSEKNSVAESMKERDELRLAGERRLEDTAIEKERSRNDLALERERGEKERALTTLLSAERLTTDKNLLSERTKTDVDATLAAKLLTVEREAHSNTKSALTTREEFVAIVSHDLKNPIGAIRSAMEMLLENHSRMAVDNESRRLFELIKRNADSSLRLINDILDMERIVEGKLSMQIAPHSVGDIIDEAVEIHSSVATSKKISLKTVPLRSDYVAACDRDRVSQILSNLIGNALKFTPEGGTVCVGCEQNKNEIQISVSDTGPGIPENQKDRIFERFAQIGNKNRSGLGLGLYISKTLVESQDGKLWVRSDGENGSTFTFTLPVAKIL